jgi:glucosyl-dolichyl phosphate glucuronosyltransferase
MREAGGRPDVTVVVATRNRAALLPHCLASLLEQETTSRFEVVVVDNGSDDDTAEVIRAWAERDARIRGVLEPMVGLSRAKNAGIEDARGELVLFTDDDVILDSAWIEAYVSFFARRRPEPRTLAGGPVLPLPHDLSVWPTWLDDAAKPDLPGLFHGTEERALGRFDYIWGANMAARAELFAELGGFDEGLGRSDELRGTFEDVELNERVAEAGGECHYLPAAVVHHRVDVGATRPRMIVRKAFNRGANDFLRAARGSYYAPSARVPSGRALSAGVLALRLPIWLAGALLFRLTRRRGAFELARRSAWAAGWCLAVSVNEGRTGAGALKRLALVARAIALEATPAEANHL